jgi:hypothetical protein
VPEGWYAPDILREHAKLGGTSSLAGPEATEPDAPSWLPERRAWLQYRQMLYRISSGISAGDPACIELAVRFIELWYIGSYSGYIRSRLYRRLKRARISGEQARRLDAHFWSLALAGTHSYEFKDYVRLWQVVLDRSELPSRLEQLARARGPEKAAWLAVALRPNNSSKPTPLRGAA